MRALIIAIAGAGGDLPPLMAVAGGLKQRGHEVRFLGDRPVADAVAALGAECTLLSSDLSLGAILGQFARSSQGLTVQQQGERFRDELADWSLRVAEVATGVMQTSRRPDLILTSRFGIGAAALATGPTPLVMVNSTFYVGPDPPRPRAADFSSRALPLFDYLVPMEERAGLVLHATDRVFDFDNDQLPPTHRYVGPLIWEPDSAAAPDYLQTSSDTWILATISSQIQDDVPLARAVLDAVSSRSVRLLMTTGGSHAKAEFDPIPENARVEDYVSHRAALQRSHVLLSHAGHGSVMKALWYGVPMVLIPWGRDQPGVAARAERLGVARVVPRDQLTAETVGSALDAVLENPTFGEAARSHAARLRQQDPVAVACAAIEAL